MVLSVVHYGHPALRTRGKKIDKIDDKIRQLAVDMLETMEAYEGVGLAAHQVGLPIRLAVVDVSQVRKWPSVLRVGGKKQNLRDHMPMILINAEVEPFGKETVHNEGCLSFPEIHGDVTRPFSVRVRAHSIDGEPMEFEADGFLARAIQHEQDHLDGVLFIDRMDPTYVHGLADDLRRLQSLPQEST